MAFITLVVHLLGAFVLCTASSEGGPCEDGVCEVFTKPRRSGGAMIQTRAVTTAASAPGKTEDIPDAQYTKLTTRMTTMEARVGTLEEDSSQGREALKAQLAELTTDVDNMKSSGTGSVDDTTSRVGEAEGMVSALADEVDEGNTVVRQGIEELKEQYDALAKNVGDAFASLSALQLGAKPKQKQHKQHHASKSKRMTAEDPPAAAAGGSLIARTTALEARVQTLESASDEEREELKSQLEALDKRVDSIKSGGVGSLDHTMSRVGSAEQSIETLRDSVAKTNAGLKMDLDSLEANVDTLSAKVGSLAMLQQEPTLPLTTRVNDLENRIEALEEKSTRGRGDLQLALTSISDKVEDMKEKSGVTSLKHTTLRQDGVETNVAELQQSVKDQRANLESATAALKAKLDALQGRVGAALLQAE